MRKPGQIAQGLIRDYDHIADTVTESVFEPQQSGSRA